MWLPANDTATPGRRLGLPAAVGVGAEGLAALRVGGDGAAALRVKEEGLAALRIGVEDLAALRKKVEGLTDLRGKVGKGLMADASVANEPAPAKPATPHIEALVNAACVNAVASAAAESAEDEAAFDREGERAALLLLHEAMVQAQGSCLGVPHATSDGRCDRVACGLFDGYDRHRTAAVEEETEAERGGGDSPEPPPPPKTSPACDFQLQFVKWLYTLRTLAGTKSCASVVLISLVDAAFASAAGEAAAPEQPAPAGTVDVPKFFSAGADLKELLAVAVGQERRERDAKRVAGGTSAACEAKEQGVLQHVADLASLYALRSKYVGTSCTRVATMQRWHALGTRLLASRAPPVAGHGRGRLGPAGAPLVAGAEEGEEVPRASDDEEKEAARAAATAGDDVVTRASAGGDEEEVATRALRAAVDALGRVGKSHALVLAEADALSRQLLAHGLVDLCDNKLARAADGAARDERESVVAARDERESAVAARDERESAVAHACALLRCLARNDPSPYLRHCAALWLLQIAPLRLTLLARPPRATDAHRVHLTAATSVAGFACQQLKSVRERAVAHVWRARAGFLVYVELWLATLDAARAMLCPLSLYPFAWSVLETAIHATEEDLRRLEPDALALRDGDSRQPLRGDSRPAEAAGRMPPPAPRPPTLTPGAGRCAVPGCSRPPAPAEGAMELRPPRPDVGVLHWTLHRADASGVAVLRNPLALPFRLNPRDKSALLCGSCAHRACAAIGVKAAWLLPVGGKAAWLLPAGDKAARLLPPALTGGGGGGGENGDWAWGEGDFPRSYTAFCLAAACAARSDPRRAAAKLTLPTGEPGFYTDLLPQHDGAPRPLGSPTPRVRPGVGLAGEAVHELGGGAGADVARHRYDALLSLAARGEGAFAPAHPEGPATAHLAKEAGMPSILSRERPRHLGPGPFAGEGEALARERLAREANSELAARDPASAAILGLGLSSLVRPRIFDVVCLCGSVGMAPGGASVLWHSRAAPCSQSDNDDDDDGQSEAKCHGKAAPDPPLPQSGAAAAAASDVDEDEFELRFACDTTLLSLYLVLRALDVPAPPMRSAAAAGPPSSPAGSPAGSEAASSSLAGRGTGEPTHIVATRLRRGTAASGSIPFAQLPPDTLQLDPETARRGYGAPDLSEVPLNGWYVSGVPRVVLASQLLVCGSLEFAPAVPGRTEMARRLYHHGCAYVPAPSPSASDVPPPPSSTSFSFAAL